jgi:hypothetical protein
VVNDKNPPAIDQSMKLLNREYTKYHPERKPWESGLFSDTVVLFIFLLFQPFGFREKQKHQTLAKAVENDG